MLFIYLFKDFFYIYLFIILMNLQNSHALQACRTIVLIVQNSKLCITEVVNLSTLSQKHFQYKKRNFIFRKYIVIMLEVSLLFLKLLKIHTQNYINGNNIQYIDLWKVMYISGVCSVCITKNHCCASTMLGMWTQRRIKMCISSGDSWYVLDNRNRSKIKSFKVSYEILSAKWLKQVQLLNIFKKTLTEAWKVA